ncbi:MAG: LamG domain-containing protein [Bacteroidota bacterium]
MKRINKILIPVAAIILASGCQKMKEPALGTYPADSNPPGGPLEFYVAFDGATANTAMNAVDSTRANFPIDNPLVSTDGVNGKGVQGEAQKFIKYSKPNSWAAKSKSFTISFWYKKDGQTKNNVGGNGPEHVLALKSSNGHWSGAQLLVFLEGDNAAGAVKVMIADATNADNWFTWEGGNTIPGLLDNNWHHVALVYSNATSTMTLYIDGTANSNTRSWGTHGDINIDKDAITELRIGAGPGTGYDTDDWLTSSFKGSLDQVRMYSTDISVSEIQSLFVNKQ